MWEAELGQEAKARKRATGRGHSLSLDTGTAAPSLWSPSATPTPPVHAGHKAAN